MNDEIEVAGLPEVRICYENGSHSVQVGIKHVANLDFVLAMLEMAKVNLTFQRNMLMAQQMEAQQIEVRKAQALSQQIKRGGLIR